LKFAICKRDYSVNNQLVNLFKKIILIN